MKSIRFAAAAFVASALVPPVADAAARATPHGVYSFAGVALSPAGDRVAAVDTLNPFEPSTARARGPLTLRSARTGALLASYDPCPSCRYLDPTWSPDGKSLAFVALDTAKGRATLNLLQADKIRQVALVDGVAAKPCFSPDGRTLALLATPGAHKQTGAVEAGAEQVGDIDALEVADEQRIGVVPVSGGSIRYVSPADTFVYEYDWRPDSQGFVATAAQGNGDNNWWIAKLVAIGLDGAPARVIAAPKMQINSPVVSSDGKSVAVIGGLMSDFGPVGGDVYTAPFIGGALTDVTPGIKASFTSLADWRGGRIDATLLRGPDAEIVTLDPSSGAVATRWSAPMTFTASGVGVSPRISLSADRAQVAMSAEDFTHPPEIFAGAPGAGLGAITHANAALPATVTAKAVTWTSGGHEVQGWLLSGLNPPAGKRPMVVDIHGGPSSATTPTYMGPSGSGVFATADWLKKGYFVFYPNPRGSYGQGEAFTRANVRDFGGGDLKDILAGIDKVETIAPVDDARLGVYGHSYGGFMTMWTVTHSHRFKAAVAGAGLSDWISYYGENGIDQWMIPFFGASAYDDPAIYQKLSPITYIKDAKTPTLIYVGARDVECPPPQSFEFWHGLRAVGTPTHLIVYAGQGHAIRDPADLADLRRREVAWFDKYL